MCMCNIIIIIIIIITLSYSVTECIQSIFSCLNVPYTSASDANADAVVLRSPAGRRVSSDLLTNCSCRNHGRRATSFWFQRSGRQSAAAPNVEWPRLLSVTDVYRDVILSDNCCQSTVLTCTEHCACWMLRDVQQLYWSESSAPGETFMRTVLMVFMVVGVVVTMWAVQRNRTRLGKR